MLFRYKITQIFCDFDEYLKRVILRLIKVFFWWIGQEWALVKWQVLRLVVINLMFENFKLLDIILLV